MCSSYKWRFPNSNFGDQKGMSTGDDETFKKSPYKSFAREILQNSIDARLVKDRPVQVEIKEFEMNPSEIPDLDGIKRAFNNIIDFWSHKPGYVDEYKRMLQLLNSEKINCLKISDYNTTGLTGIFSQNREKNKWIALTQGAGVSEKTSTVSGGSKGIGKNAAFELSDLKMVFYSTLTLDGSSGSMGVAKLISGYAENDTSSKRDHTQGTGYYVTDDYNTPLTSNPASLSNYIGKREQSGTDILIVGFDSEEDWEENAINSILDSFMVAIVRDQLSISINEINIDSSSIGDLVQSELVAEKNRANIRSQYKLVSGGDDVQVFDIETEFGTPKLYVWVVPKEEENLALHECVMVRHPLMKIKTIKLPSIYNVSAMCIIEDDKLGEQLLKIENPQHIDWEVARIKDRTLRKTVKNTINHITEAIRKIVTDCIKIDDNEPIDPFGAGEFLPENSDNVVMSGNESSNVGASSEKITVSKKKEIKFCEKKAIHEGGTEQYGLSPDILGVDTEIEGDIAHPTGHNDVSGNTSHPGDEYNGENEGDSLVFKKKIISGIKYKWLVLDKAAGNYLIKFTSPGNYDKCYLTISLIDDSNMRNNVDIYNLKKNGISIVSDNKMEFGPFSIFLNEVVTLNVIVSEKEYFSSEVKIICR